MGEDKIMSLFETKRAEDVCGGRTKPRKLKIQKQSEDKIIKNTRNPFGLKKENEEIKHKTIRDIKNVFEKEEDYHKAIRAGSSYSNNYIESQSIGV